MTSYAGGIAWRRAEISGPIKKEKSTGGGWRKRWISRGDAGRESCDLRSRRKPRVLHIQRVMSFVSSYHRPEALNSLYLEFQEARPELRAMISILARDTPAEEEKESTVSRAISLCPR